MRNDPENHRAIIHPMEIQQPPPGYIEIPSKVSGIKVFAPAPEGADVSQGVIEFKCPQCGASTAYSIADGGLKCTHCGYYSPPQGQLIGRQAKEFEFTLDTMQQAEYGWGEEREDLECQTCGARTSISKQNLAHTCAFCGSNKLIQRQAASDVLRPRFLIPFQVEIEKCQPIVQQWLSSSWMVPRALQKLATQVSFNGIYLPFWTFDSVSTAIWKGEVGHTEHERYYENGEWKVRAVTVWRWESGRVQENFDDLLVSGTVRLSQLLLEQINKYNLSQLRPYEPIFLAGLQALAFDVPLEAAWEAARNEMRERTRFACRGQASTSQIRNFSMSLDFSKESWRYILLPVYLAGYQAQGRSYQVVINGQTGSIGGQRPVDWMKVWLVIAAILSPGVLLALAGLLTIILGGVGVLLGGIGFVLLLVGLIVAVLILRKAMAMDDI